MINYDLVLENLIKELNVKNEVPTLLLHSCCAPCSTAVLTRLADSFKITVLYYNPCIHPQEEYEKRKTEQIKFIGILNKTVKNKIEFLNCDYFPETFFEITKGLENEPEGGKRCYVCYNQRLSETAKIAKKLGIEYFGTTLSVSPYKHADWLNEIGEKLNQQIGVKFLFADFKKQNGYLKSIQLSREFNIYRQDYCGCVFSLNNKNKISNNGND